MIKSRRARDAQLGAPLPESSGSSPLHNVSGSSDEKSMQQQHINGALSPLHTRRGPHGTGASTAPDFAEFDYRRECPRLVAVAEEEKFDDIVAAFADLDKLQEELEHILIHTTDHQKKICGEITFINTGDYPANDISRRPMPVYELNALEPIPGCSTTSNKTAENPYGEMDSPDDNFDVWPPVNLPRKFWVFVREYLDPIDEEYLQLWWSDIVQLFYADDDDGRDLPPRLFPSI
ncbi:unnamed protein product [Gongylonema pulchrum]|uniref:Guanine nucleotide-binding protein subunit gamma 1 n=1 Tax=Gongylonema pulchrum TaxID=637853 RepID=A0A183DPX0_9BILA|nr:unnamed protein product [Gongylonema pulchrum]